MAALLSIAGLPSQARAVLCGEHSSTRPARQVRTWRTGARIDTLCVMCGRIVLKAPSRRVAQEFELTEEPVLAPRFNIAPGQKIAVVRHLPGRKRVCDQLRWGLIPPWARSPRDGDRLFNARGETAHVKPAYREAFATRRCLIPVDGFYEWRKHPGPKQPFYFSGADGRLLALAGLWSRWIGPDGVVHESCAVMTTDANRIVRPVHDRMPAILARGHLERWLACRPADINTEDPRDLLAPAAEDILRVWPVAALVNSIGADGPELCTPLEHEPPEQLDLF